MLGVPVSLLGAFTGSMLSPRPDQQDTLDLIDEMRVPSGESIHARLLRLAARGKGPKPRARARPSPRARRGAWGFSPKIEPYETGMLAVSELHEIYYEECGNPDGKPVRDPAWRPGRRHQPDHAALLRSRRATASSCSTSAAAAARRRTPSLEENTTWDLVADIERLREHLGIERWQVFGGSWGSTLALAYAETPSRARQRAGPARHLPAAPSGARLVLPGRRSWIFPDALEDYLRAHPARRSAAT